MALNAAVTISGVPATAQAGAPFQVSLTVQNLSAEVFQPGVYRVGLRQPGNASPPDDASWGNPRVDLPGPIAPGQTLSFQASLTPGQAGALTVCCQMVKEGVAWFGQPTQAFPVSVAPSATPPPAPTGVQLPGLRGDPVDLVGKMVLNTGPKVAVTGSVAQDTFTNTSGRRMLIQRAKIWVGFDKGTTADCHIEVTRSDGSLCVCGQFDHYVDGNEGGAREYAQFDPYFALEPGETLTVAHLCNPFTLPGRQHYHVTLTLWWRWA